MLYIRKSAERGGYSEAYGAYGLFGTAPSGARNAAYGNADISPRQTAHALCHLICSFDGYCAKGGKSLLPNSKHSRFYAVCIGNDASENRLGGAGDGCDSEK